MDKRGCHGSDSQGLPFLRFRPGCLPEVPHAPRFHSYAVCRIRMMWIVLWNLSVLPLGLLPVAAPFSMAEVFGAVQGNFSG